MNYNFLQKNSEKTKMKTVAVVAVLQLNSAGCFMIFLPQNGLDIAIFPIFAIAKSGEIDLARESAFFALFLSSELGQFA